jgi:hypothetical protein
MTAIIEATDRCTTCGADAEGAQAYCHIYLDGETRVYCSPACAQRGLLGRDTAGGGTGTPRSDYLRELAETRRWERWG